MFKRITTYRDSEALNPGENKVTEALAVLLEEVDGLGFYLAGEWLGEPDADIDASLPDGDTTPWSSLDDECRDAQLNVATQVPVWASKSSQPQLGFVDLELRFSTADSTDRVVRVEVKRGTGPHDDQLERYREGKPKPEVVLLAPFADFKDFPTEQMPREVAKRSWQRTAERIASFPRDNESEISEVEQWLIKQFIRFLREEKLMSPEAVGPQHLVAMANHNEAKEALVSLNDIANRRIAETWGDVHAEEKKNGRREDKGYTSFARYHEVKNAKSRELGHIWFEFKASTEDVFDSAEELHFIAGASWGLKDGKQLVKGSEALETEYGFRWFDEGSCGRFMRVATPSSVLSGATLEEQGRSLGDWALKSFELLSSKEVEQED